MGNAVKYFINPSEVERRELAPGITLRIMWGENIMMSMVEIAPNSEVPMHSHPHEQAGMVLQGEFDFTIGGETTRMRPFSIVTSIPRPPNLPRVWTCISLKFLGLR